MSVEPTSVEPTSVEPTSVEPTSVEPTSVEQGPDPAGGRRARRRYLHWTGRLIDDLGVVVSIAALALLGIAAAAGTTHRDVPAERPTFTITYDR